MLRPMRLAAAALACTVFMVLPARAIQYGWTELPNSPLAGNSQRHDDLSFIDNDRGWLVNGDGQVWHTPDGGGTWALLHNTTVYNRAVAFTDSLNGWIGTLYQLNGEALLRTQDGGLTWQQQVLPEPKPRGICGLYAASDSVVCGVGAYYGYPRFIRTDDSGVTWNVLDMSEYCGALVDTYWFSPDVGLAVGSTAPGNTRKARILMTIDGGQTWSVRWTGTRNKELCWKISFVNRSTGFVSIENLNNGVGAAYFLKTVNGGMTWTEYLFESTYRNCQGIGFVNESTGWIGGWNFNTEATTNGGLFWGPAYFGYNVNRFRFLSSSLGYACGQKVYKYEGDVSAVPEPPSPAEALLLGQNRPNPFGAGTVIPYRVTREGHVSLQVFDLQGRRVRTLVEGVRAPGEYTAAFDAQDLAGGAYFYQLVTPAGIETKRMWLVR